MLFEPQAHARVAQSVFACRFHIPVVSLCETEPDSLGIQKAKRR